MGTPVAAALWLAAFVPIVALVARASRDMGRVGAPTDAATRARVKTAARDLALGLALLLALGVLGLPAVAATA